VDVLGAPTIEQEIQRRVLNTVNKQRQVLIEQTGVDSSLTEYDIKQYLGTVLKEIKTLKDVEEILSISEVLQCATKDAQEHELLDITVRNAKTLRQLTDDILDVSTIESNADDKREKIQALSLAKECYSMKLDLLTNATVVDDAIRFVSQKSKEEVESASNSNNEAQV
jgi:signal transduction histidine kinase